MSFFKKIFGGELSEQSVREILASGDAQRALDQARRLRKRSGASSEIDALVAACEEKVVRDLLTKADAAREEGFPDDALEWLAIARNKLSAAQGDHVEMLRGEIETRQQELDAVRDEAAAATLRDELQVTAVDDGDAADDSGEGTAGDQDEEDLESVDQHFAALLNTLRDEVAEHYAAAGRGDATFRAVVVAVNEGDGKAALEQLAELDEAKRQSPIVRLEQGRALLHVGDHEAAARELTVAMEELGEEALDHQGATVLLELWAEAALESGQAEEVKERLGSSDQLERRPPMVELYVDALVRLDEDDEALETLRAAVERFPMQSDFTYRLALRLTEVGEHDEARKVLRERVELAMRPGASQLLHSGVLELLCEHLLQDDAPKPSRLHELLDIDAHLLGGTSCNVAWLRSKTLELEGRSAEAEAAATVARDLAARQARTDAESTNAARGHRLVLVDPPPVPTD